MTITTVLLLQLVLFLNLRNRSCVAAFEFGSDEFFLDISSMQSSSSSSLRPLSEVEELIQTENQFAEIIRRYVDAERQRLARLKRLADDYESHIRVDLEMQRALNPIGSFLTVKRIIDQWTQMKHVIMEHSSIDLLRNFTTTLRQQGRIPQDEHLQSITKAVLRIQDTYDLATHSMADGKFPGVGDSPKLTAMECFDIGVASYLDDDHYHAVLWLEQSLRQAEEETAETAEVGELITDILDYLSWSHFEQGNLIRAIALAKRLTKRDPFHERAEANVIHFEKALAAKKHISHKAQLNPRTVVAGETIPEREVYDALCRGENLMPAKNRSRLLCYYKRNKPFLLLAPIKVEVLHLKPKVLLFRDAISDEETATVREHAQPVLDRASVRGTTIKDFRSAKNGWLSYEHETLARIYRRTELLTDLNMETAEYFQVASYGLGGHYFPHYDFDDSPLNGRGVFATGDIDWGNRVATALYYLAEPAVGGATVFPILKLAVQPEKNSVLFWHNLLRNGKGDLTTRHAACPVVAGVKWVANVWLHEPGQEFHRPCALNEWEYE